jgi:hypothetical protein
MLNVLHATPFLAPKIDVVVCELGVTGFINFRNSLDEIEDHPKTPRALP